MFQKSQWDDVVIRFRLSVTVLTEMYEIECIECFGRLSVLGVSMPMYHSSGVLVKASTTFALVLITLSVCAILLAVFMAQALDGHDMDTAYWCRLPCIYRYICTMQKV